VDELKPASGPADATHAAGVRASLDGLAQLSSSTLALPGLLARVAEYAAAAIPGADGTGVTLMESGQPDVLAASTEFVAEVDAIQYGLDEGLCISVARERCTIRSGALDDTARWPTFAARVVSLGVHSVLSLPMIVDEETVGAINVYAHDNGRTRPGSRPRARSSRRPQTDRDTWCAPWRASGITAGSSTWT
jgi:GAF domain-containing protein